MSDDNNLKVSINTKATAVGVINLTSVSDEDKVRIVISNAGAGNIIVIKCRIIGQLDFDTIATITGNSKQVIKVSTYDEMQIECTTFDSLTNHVGILASSFNPAGGSTVIDAPTGGSVDNDEITFTSSDNSVTIVADPLNNTIDFVATGSGSPFIKYVKVVGLGDWVGPSANEYTLTIAHSFHGVISPIVTCYETNGLEFDEILVPIKIDASHNIIITVPQTPDSRFVGKIVIE